MRTQIYRHPLLPYFSESTDSFSAKGVAVNKNIHGIPSPLKFEHPLRANFLWNQKFSCTFSRLFCPGHLFEMLSGGVMILADTVLVRETPSSKVFLFVNTQVV